MSSRCRICTDEMPKDRRGADQVCPRCRKKGHKELFDPAYKEPTKVTEMVVEELTDIKKVKPRHSHQVLDRLINLIRNS